MKVTSFEDITGLWGKTATDGEKPEILEMFCLCLHWYFRLLLLLLLLSLSLLYIDAISQRIFK